MANVHSYPSDPNPTHHIVLDLGGQKHGLRLDKGSAGYAIDERTTESSFGAIFSQSTKKYGNDPYLTLMEQREWTDGRGVRNYEDSISGYFDAGAAWSLTAGHLLPCPQWHRATGRPDVAEHAPGSMTWKELFGENKYISTSFTGTAATYTHIKIWVRRVGTPGTLTLKLCQNSSGSPGTVLKTLTKDTTNITDYISVEADFTTSQLLSATTYHIFVYGVAADNFQNHWEIGVDDDSTGSKVSTNGTTWTTPSNTFQMYHRLTTADIGVSGWFFFARTNVSDPDPAFDYDLYFVTHFSDEPSQLVGVNDDGSVDLIDTGGALSVVSSRPLCVNGIIYFPMGPSDPIVRWNGTTFADDGSNVARFMVSGTDGVDNIIWIGGINYITKADQEKWGTNLTFDTGLEFPDQSVYITSLLMVDNTLRIFTENGGGYMDKDSTGKDIYVPLLSTMSATPSPRNGATSIYWNSIAYYSWLNTMMREFQGTTEDIGQAWKGKGLPGDRQGYFSCSSLDSARMYVGVNAGDGTSSVQVYNGLTWMEVFRCPQAGYKISDVMVQPKNDAAPRVWIETGGDIFYFDLPADVASPLYDPDMLYQHEFYTISPTFDDTAASLPKYIRQFTVTSDNLGSGIFAEVDYQVDENIGTDNWVYAGRINVSPEGILKLHIGNIRAIRFRLRCLTNDVSVPPVIQATVIDGFTRSPNRTIWNVRVTVGGKTLSGGNDADPSELLGWLRDVSQYPGSIRMNSMFEELNNKQVIISPPVVYREYYNKLQRKWRGSFTLSIMDVT